MQKFSNKHMKYITGVLPVSIFFFFGNYYYSYKDEKSSSIYGLKHKFIVNYYDNKEYADLKHEFIIDYYIENADLMEEKEVNNSQ